GQDRMAGYRRRLWGRHLAGELGAQRLERHPVTLPELTELMSELGSEDPHLYAERSVQIFVQRMIDRMKERGHSPSSLPTAFNTPPGSSSGTISSSDRSTGV